MRVSISVNTINIKMKQMISYLAPIEAHRIGGAGNKVSRIALNDVDAYC
jgi:3'-phosphoadenosine 5'-phosphosulfate (PAPS) 3'-phosphatase